MISLRHCGLYVSDIALVESFYEKVFNMRYICRQTAYHGDFDFLFDQENTCVLMTKLITEKGVETGSGDMIELLQVVSPKMPSREVGRELYDSGTMHFALECSFEEVLPKVTQYGGIIRNEPIKMWSGNSMCIIQDPEGNYIELLQRK